MIGPARRGAVLALGLAACLAAAPPAGADQRDDRLAPLFEALAEAPNPALARDAEQRIWAIWFEPPEARAGRLLEEGRRAARAGNAEAAEQTLDRLVEDYPGFAEGWNQRAIVRYLNGDLAGSLADIDRTLALEPRHFGALSGRGQCYLQLERYREAARAFEDALAINPWLDSVRLQLDMIEARLNRLPQPI